MGTNYTNPICIRRSRCLVAFWETGSLVVENYLTNKKTTIAPLIAQLLQEIDDYHPKNSVLEHFGSIPVANEIIEELIKQDVLIIQGSALDAKECLIEKKWEWNQDVRYFHYSTQHIVYEDNFEIQRTSLARLAREIPPPDAFKDYGRSDVKLLGSFDDSSGEFWNVLRSRRTKRSFVQEEISLSDLSNILLWTWGRTHLITDQEVGSYILRTSPSGGARHPIEVYPVILRVNGVTPGIYHYSVKRHELECLRTGMFTDLAVRLCSNQEWVRDAAVVFFMTAVVNRTMWKYKQTNAYRVIQLDAGHIGQTFHLVCTKLGLAPFTTAATQDKEIESELGIDGVTEIPIYTAVTGVPSNGIIRNNKGG